jgi:hypothetical protein
MNSDRKVVGIGLTVFRLQASFLRYKKAHNMYVELNFAASSWKHCFYRNAKLPFLCTAVLHMSLRRI